MEHMPASTELDVTNREINNTQSGSGQLTIAEAKRGLALMFGVSPDAVEITIRG